MALDLRLVLLEELQVHHKGNVRDKQDEKWKCIHRLGLLHQLRQDQHHRELQDRVFVWEQDRAKGSLYCLPVICLIICCWPTLQARYAMLATTGPSVVCPMVISAKLSKVYFLLWLIISATEVMYLPCLLLVCLSSGIIWKLSMNLFNLLGRGYPLAFDGWESRNLFHG